MDLVGGEKDVHRIRLRSLGHAGEGLTHLLFGVENVLDLMDHGSGRVLYENEHRASGRLRVSPRWLRAQSAHPRGPKELLPSQIRGPLPISLFGGQAGFTRRPDIGPPGSPATFGESRKDAP